MKNLFTIALLFVASVSFCQKKPFPKIVATDTIAAQSPAYIEPTSFDEYNYMTKGYKMQLEAGLDAKQGYSVVDLPSVQKGNYVFTYKLLLRSGINELAGIIVLSKSLVSNKLYYTGIPVNNPQLYASFENSVSLWDEPMTTAFANATALFYSNTMASYFVNQKK